MGASLPVPARVAGAKSNTPSVLLEQLYYSFHGLSRPVMPDEGIREQEA
jgi:hypothetical protein